MELIELTSESQIRKLKHLPFNRPYSVRKDLIESMHMNGFINPVIVIETDIITGKVERFICDGQHRILTASHLGINPYITIIKPKKVETIEDLVYLVSSLNSKTKPWVMSDYANAYAFLNYPEYKKLIAFTEKTPYTMSTIAKLLQGIEHRGASLKTVREGRFVATQEESAEETIEFAAELSKYYMPTSRILLAIAMVMRLKEFNKKKFTERYAKEWTTIKQLGLDDYTDIFRSWIS